ncbi:hypothetical protein CBR_g48545 [Chara braunii]|uniref:AtTam37 zinc finger domain-containing protein n=1 Tax=Chara braunii TaxID=69332 RepID=A0A388M2Z5_CHABU|nr:hypothetical protein CBR_g48545 [Chara braunii]|eukprot:GBG88934.1 hypothetical protein CBR_g48545 [Chara braunii]
MSSPSPSPSTSSSSVSVYDFPLRDRHRREGGLDAWKTQLQLVGMNERIVSSASLLAKCPACQGNGYVAVWPKNPAQAFHKVYRDNEASTASQQEYGLEFEQLPPEVEAPLSAPTVSCRQCGGMGVTKCNKCKGNAIRLVPNFNQLFKLPHKSKTFLKTMRSPLREVEKAQGGKVTKEEFLQHVFGEALFKDAGEDPSLRLLEDWDRNEVAVSVVKNRPEALRTMHAVWQLPDLRDRAVGDGLIGDNRQKRHVADSVAQIEAAVSQMEPPANMEQKQQVLKFLESVKSTIPAKKWKQADVDHVGQALAERQRQLWEDQWRKQQAKELMKQKISEWEQREEGAYDLQAGLLGGK